MLLPKMMNVMLHNKISHNSKLRMVTGLTGGITLYVIMLYCPAYIFSVIIFLACAIMLMELKKILQKTPLFFWLLAPLYPTVPCCILIFFNQTSSYKFLLYYLFVTVAIFDSASYFAGKSCKSLWTPTKIAPSISPGKTWEGFFGGYLGVTIILFLILYQHPTHLNWQTIFFLSTAISVVAFCGDLFESYLKRYGNVKDSGTILPGHGGLLDRCDAILITAIFFFIYKDVLLKLLQ